MRQNARIYRDRELAWMLTGVSVIGVFLGVCIACIVAMVSFASAEGATYTRWVICEPGSEVLLRESPSRHAEIVGAVVCGEAIRTDGRERNGYIHLVGVSNETGEGWIHEGYVVYDEPVRIDAEGVITARGRVACRKSIGGKRKAWAAAGSTVTVYWISREWAVTDKGYISSDYLEVP